MILHFRTPWPKQSYQHVQDVSQSYNKGVSYALSSFTGVFLFLIGSFVGSSDSVQDSLIRMAASAAVGYTVLLHAQLYIIFPALAFLPLFCCLLAAHFIAKSCRKVVQNVPHNHSPLTQVVKASVEDYESTPLSRGYHTDRRATITKGLQLLHEAQNGVENDSSSDYLSLSISQVSAEGLDNQLNSSLGNESERDSFDLNVQAEGGSSDDYSVMPPFDDSFSIDIEI